MPSGPVWSWTPLLVRGKVRTRKCRGYVLLEHKHIKFLGHILNRPPVHKGIHYFLCTWTKRSYVSVNSIHWKEETYLIILYAVPYIESRNLYFRFFPVLFFLHLIISICRSSFWFLSSLPKISSLESNGMHSNYSFLTDSMEVWEAGYRESS